MIDYSKISNVKIAGVDKSDYPDFCDAYIEFCFIDGVEATDAELELINKDHIFVHQQVTESLY
jgi:hypothetical protein